MPLVIILHIMTLFSGKKRKCNFVSQRLSLRNNEDNTTDSLPYSPAPLACTTLSGMRSRSKWAISSINWMSCSRMGPRGPTVRELSLSDSGHPWPVVSTSSFCNTRPSIIRVHLTHFLGVYLYTIPG